MTAQETNLLNAFETTLTGTIGASDLTMTVNSVVDSASNTLTAPCYLVINPDSATNREVLLVSSINVGTKTLTISAIGNRYLTGSAATSGLSHASGSVVRMSPLQQHIEDINDRVDTIINSDGTAVVTTGVVKDEDNMASDSATHLATQQSIKAYVDSQVTAQDLDFLGDTGSGAVDLDSQDFTIAGTANEIETSASGQTLTIGLPSSITVNVTGNLTGNVTGDVTGNVTGDLTGNVTATSVLADGVTATTQSASDNSTKVATTAYVDAQVTAEGLDFGGDTGTGSVDLDSQTFTIAGTTNEIETSATGQTLTIGLPSSITVNVTGNLTGNVTGNVTGDLTGDVTGNVTGNTTGTVTATSTLADGVTATTQSAGDNSTKVATTAYVDSISVDDNLTVGDGSTTTTIDLDTQTLTIAGTANEIETTATAQTITISLPATINANTTGNAATATALETARTIAGQSFDGTGNITIAADDLSDVSTTGITNGQVLAYNSTSGNFEPSSPAAGDITAVNTNANSGLAGGSASGDISLTVDPSNLTDGTGITVDTASDFLIMEDVTDGTVYKVNPDQIASGSANALVDGDSDFTITDGVANGIHYELDNTDMADWNQGGVALTAAGGMFRHNQTQSATFTVAATEGTVLAGPITITGTVTNAGTMVIL